MILTSLVPIRPNQSYLQFLHDYREAVQFYVDYMWNNRYYFTTINKKNNQLNHKVFDISRNQFDLPGFYPTLHIDSPLSGRALKCASAQALGILKSKTEKLKSMRYNLRKFNRDGVECKRLQRKYDRLCSKLKKPILRNISPEVSSICCNYDNGIITLSSIGSKYGVISIPVALHYQCKQFESNNGVLMNSFQLSKKSIAFRYEFKIEKKTNGSIEGADPGIKTTITISDGQITKKDIHGHDLDSIIRKICKKKKGSKAFKRAQAHRTNYINWSIKQLDLTDIKQINLEKMKNVGKGKRKNRYLQAFTYREINTAIEKKCELEGVKLEITSNEYRSQRCNSCGFTHESNRKSKVFSCKNCGYTNDADLNAALNHKVKLYDLPFGFRNLKLNKKGFYWLETCLRDKDYQEYLVPDARENR